MACIPSNISEYLISIPILYTSILGVMNTFRWKRLTVSGKNEEALAYSTWQKQWKPACSWGWNEGSDNVRRDCEICVQEEDKRHVNGRPTVRGCRWTQNCVRISSFLPAESPLNVQRHWKTSLLEQERARIWPKQSVWETFKKKTLHISCFTWYIREWILKIYI